MSKEILTFIFTAASPAEFTQNIYKNRNIIRKANAIIIHDVSVFELFFNMAADNFRFRLLIHAGLADNDNGTIGESGFNFLGELHDLPGLKGKAIPFISRKKADFIDQHTKQETLYRDVDGYRCYLAGMANDPKHIDDFVNKLPVFEKKELMDNNGIPSQNNEFKKDIDFAVLTALYIDEFQTYMDHCDLQLAKIIGNCYNARFSKKNTRVIDDYTENFALIHQEQMGLVDAAIYSTQIIDKIDPRFLLMGGVCGGREGVVNLYDIIIPTIIYDYGTGKLNGKGDTKEELAVSFSNDTEIKAKGVIESKNFRAESEQLLTTFLERKKNIIIQNMRVLMPETQKENFPPNFNIHIAQFTCGPWVIKAENFLDDFLLKKFSVEIRGLEMESYSINRVGNIAQQFGRYSLVVKSVMDFTDPNKTDGAGGQTKKFAALMSFLCIRAMMPVLKEFHDPRGN